MTGGAWVGLRGFVGRETMFLVTRLPRTPQGDELVRGARLALEENGSRAGALRVEPLEFASRPGVLSSIGFPISHVVLLDLDRLPGLIRDGSGGFLVPLPGDEEGELAAEAAAALGARSAYLLGPDPGWSSRPYLPISDFQDVVITSWNFFPSDPLPPSRAYRFLQAARLLGIEVAGVEPAPEEPGAYEALLDRVARWGTDVVYADVPGRGGRLVRDLRARGFRGRLFLTSASLESGFLDIAGRAAGGVYFISGLVPEPPEDFSRRYRARYGAAPGPYAYEGYRACRRVQDALDLARARTLEEASGVLRKLDAAGPAESLFRAGPALFRVRGGRFERVEAGPTGIR
jgi:hypothetical protein